MSSGAIELPDDGTLALSLRDLRSVTAIAQAGSLTAAARRLGFSQATLSAHLAAAESALGVSLFHRHGRGVVPTEAGRAVLRHAASVFTVLDALRTELRSSTGRAVTIGATEPAASRRIPAFLRVHERRVPSLKLSLRVGTPSEILGLVERGELELAVTPPRRYAVRGATFTRLYDQEFVLLVPEHHRLAGADVVDLLDLRGSRLLVGDDACVYRLVVEETLLRADVDVAFRARFGALTTLPHGVATGLGIALVPREIVTPPLPQTVAIPLRHPIVVPVGVLLRDDASDAARSVAAMIRADGLRSD